MYMFARETDQGALERSDIIQIESNSFKSVLEQDIRRASRVDQLVLRPNYHIAPWWPWDCCYECGCKDTFAKNRDFKFWLFFQVCLRTDVYDARRQHLTDILPTGRAGFSTTEERSYNDTDSICALFRHLDGEDG